MAIEVIQPAWWEWALLLPSLLLLWIILTRTIPVCAEAPPSLGCGLPGLLVVVVLHFWAAFGVQHLARVPFLPRGLACGLMILLADGTTCAAVLLMAWLGGRAPGALGLRRIGGPKALAAVVPAWLAFLVPLSVVVWGWLVVLQALGYQPSVQPAIHLFIQAGRRGDWLSVTAIAAGALIVAPVVEELFFRGFVFGILRARAGVLPALLLTSAFFAAFHMQPEVILPVFLVGLVLNLLYLRTGSLAHPVLFHVLFNGGTLLWIAVTG